MSKSTQRLLTIVLLTLIGVTSQHPFSSAQEPEGRDGREGRTGRSARTTRPPTIVDPQALERTRLAQFGGREMADQATTDAPRDMIALTVWVLTVTNSAAPEAEKLVGQLIDKVTNLPVVIGKSDDVRDLASRLKVAGLLQVSREYRLVTLDGQAVTSQSGANHPSIVATNITNRGRTNNIKFEQIGTSITATPRVDSGSGIQVSLDYQSSSVEKLKDVAIDQPGEGQPTFVEQVTTQQINTNLRLKSGTAVLVRSDLSQDAAGEPSGGQTRLIILGVTVIPALE